jgi:mRNA interferase RelE/StbE
VPQAPSQYRIHPDVYDDLNQIKQHNPDHAKRCFEKIDDWERMVGWGRVPQTHLEYLTSGGARNYYRDWVGRSGYRIIYEISNDIMTVVAVLPKDDDTYDLNELDRRMDRL